MKNYLASLFLIPFLFSTFLAAEAPKGGKAVEQKARENRVKEEIGKLELVRQLEMSQGKDAVTTKKSLEALDKTLTRLKNAETADRALMELQSQIKANDTVLSKYLNVNPTNSELTFKEVKIDNEQAKAAVDKHLAGVQESLAKYKDTLSDTFAKDLSKFSADLTAKMVRTVKGKGAEMTVNQLMRVADVVNGYKASVETSLKDLSKNPYKPAEMKKVEKTFKDYAAKVNEVLEKMVSIKEEFAGKTDAKSLAMQQELLSLYEKAAKNLNSKFERSNLEAAENEVYLKAFDVVLKEYGDAIRNGKGVKQFLAFLRSKIDEFKTLSDEQVLKQFCECMDTPACPTNVAKGTGGNRNRNIIEQLNKHSDI